MYPTEIQTADRIYCWLLNIEKITYDRHTNTLQEENRYLLRDLG